MLRPWTSAIDCEANLVSKNPLLTLMTALILVKCQNSTRWCRNRKNVIEKCHLAGCSVKCWYNMKLPRNDIASNFWIFLRNYWRMSVTSPLNLEIFQNMVIGVPKYRGKKWKVEKFKVNYYSNNQFIIKRSLNLISLAFICMICLVYLATKSFSKQTKGRFFLKSRYQKKHD